MQSSVYQNPELKTSMTPREIILVEKDSNIWSSYSYVPFYRMHRYIFDGLIGKKNKEFIFSGPKWPLFGRLSSGMFVLNPTKF